MSRTWKWILGVLAALVIVGIVAAPMFLWWNHTPMMVSYRLNRLPTDDATKSTNPYGKEAPVMPYGFENYQRYHMDGNWNTPFMHGGGLPVPGAFTPFGGSCYFLAGTLHILFPLGILALVAYVFYQMGKRATAPPSPPASPNPALRRGPLPGRRVAKR